MFCKTGKRLTVGYLQVTAVYKAELSSYVDVVVVSVDNHCFNGEPLQRHLASMTGGGEA